MSQNNMPIVRKENTFESFIKIIEDGNFETWEMVANALGVHRNTIVNWKQHPLAQKAIANGITNAIKQMEGVGKRDWRMWREKVALLTKENEKKDQIQVNTQTNILNIDMEALSNDELTNRIAEIEARIADLEATKSVEASKE